MYNNKRFPSKTSSNSKLLEQCVKMLLLRNGSILLQRKNPSGVKFKILGALKSNIFLQITKFGCTRRVYRNLLLKHGRRVGGAKGIVAPIYHSKSERDYISRLSTDLDYHVSK